jgi:DNA-binding NtrC family response regulator
MRRILILEDDAEICLLTRTILERRGFFPEVAESIHSVQEMLSNSKDRFDAFIVDVSLSDGNGLDFLAAVARGEFGKSHAKTPFLVVSGHAAKMLQEEMDSLKLFKGFIQKPYSVRDLVQQLESIVSDAKVD